MGSYYARPGIKLMMQNYSLNVKVFIANFVFLDLAKDTTRRRNV